MVDFNNETTIGVPATDIVRILILQYRNDLMQAIETYNKQIFEGMEAPIGTVKARLTTLHTEIRPLLNRQLTPSALEELKGQMDSEEMDDIMEALSTINTVLDTIRLTRIDTRKNINTHRVAQEDEAKGL